MPGAVQVATWVTLDASNGGLSGGCRCRIAAHQEVAIGSSVKESENHVRQERDKGLH